MLAPQIGLANLKPPVMRLRLSAGGGFFQSPCVLRCLIGVYGPVIVWLVTMAIVTTMFVSSLVQ